MRRHKSSILYTCTNSYFFSNAEMWLVMLWSCSTHFLELPLLLFSLLILIYLLFWWIVIVHVVCWVKRASIWLSAVACIYRSTAASYIASLAGIQLLVHGLELKGRRLIQIQISHLLNWSFKICSCQMVAWVRPLQS